MPVKSKVEISQNFVAFSEYMNFINLYIFSGDWSLLSLSTKAIGHDKLRGCDYISRNLRTSQTTKIRLQLHFGEFHESDEPTNESTHLRTGK